MAVGKMKAHVNISRAKPLAEAELEALLRTQDEDVTPDKEARVALLEAAIQGRSLACAQLVRLVSALETTDEKLRAGMLLVPRVADLGQAASKGGSGDILGLYRFAEQKEQIESILNESLAKANLERGFGGSKGGKARKADLPSGHDTRLDGLNERLNDLQAAVGALRADLDARDDDGRDARDTFINQLIYLGN
eukprot:g8167.t1